MADRPDADREVGTNKPALRLHVPEPKFRPGDTVDFSHIGVTEAGKQPRPDLPGDPTAGGSAPDLP